MKKSNKIQYTHKGWFFLCPIYLNADDGEGMACDARHRWLDWWFDVNELIFSVMVKIMVTFNRDYEPMFPFRVTGILTKNGGVSK